MIFGIKSYKTPVPKKLEEKLVSDFFCTRKLSMSNLNVIS